MQARLREVMLEARGAGSLEGKDVARGRAEHPVCGDRVQLDLRVENGVVADLRWQAAGCPASLALAALAAGVLPGASPERAAEVLRTAIGEHGGLDAHERHAESMLLRALAEALRGS